ncbi:hypothetical protein WJX81_005677 [Elliptochloris bilobata]|uniref:Uncharacterized protein n=1 Tax=Elliptochloris bilobata TaxID=381761 RepID=A0AAW1QXG4_9CHLO
MWSKEFLMSLHAQQAELDELQKDIKLGTTAEDVEGATTLKAAKEAASMTEEVSYAEQLHLDRLLGGRAIDQCMAAGAAAGAGKARKAGRKAKAAE